MTRIVSIVREAATGMVLSVALGAVGNVALAGDCNIEQGAQVATKCVACHAIDGPENKVGPSLAGVVGRQAAGYPDFKYSRALRKLDVVWTAEELDQFLTAPQKYARGTTMAFAGLRKDEERTDLICYLQSLNSPE